MPTFAYTVHTPKYGHDLIYVNNGVITVRIRVGLKDASGVATPVPHLLLLSPAEAAAKNGEQFK